MTRLMQKIDLSKLTGVEKEIAKLFFEQIPNPVCLTGNCAEYATRFSIVLINKKDAEFGKLYVHAYCNYHAGMKKQEKFLN